MKRLFQLLFAAALMAAFPGCNSTTSPPANSDLQNQVAALVNIDEAGDPDLAGINLPDEGELADAPGWGLASPFAVIPDSVRLCWYRHLSHTSKTIAASGDTTLMTVTLTRTNDGALKGLDCSPRRAGGEGGDTLLFDKAYSVTWTRVTQYSKLAAASDLTEEDTRWKLHAASLAHTSQNSPAVATPQILSVTISGRDTLGAPVSVQITNPGALIDPTTLPMFSAGDTVRVKVVTDTPSNRLVFIHFDMASSDRGRAQRRPLRFVALDNAFEGVFRVALGHGGGHHEGRRVRSAVWVDVLDKGTLRDTTAPYAATGWGVPYRMFRGHGMMAAY